MYGHPSRQGKTTFSTEKSLTWGQREGRHHNKGAGLAILAKCKIWSENERNNHVCQLDNTARSLCKAE